MPHDAPQSAAEAQVVIEAAGYSNVTNLEQHGATWHADATDSAGNQFQVLIDGHGEVKEKGADDDAPEAEPKR